MLTQQTKVLAIVFVAVAALLFLASVVLPTYRSRSLQAALRGARLLGVWCCTLGLVTVVVDDTSSHVTSVLLLIGWAVAVTVAVVSLRCDACACMHRHALRCTLLSHRLSR